MANVVAVIAVLTLATTVGTALTLGLYSTMQSLPDNCLWVAVAAGHLILCGTYAIMGESVIEDAVKSGFIVVCGSLILYRFSLLGIFAISAALCAFAVNQGLKRVLSKLKRVQ